MGSAALVSVAGAPGVTTLACAIAAAASPDRPLLLVEASATGGAIAARWRLDVRDTVTTTARLAMDVTDHLDLWQAAHHPWLGASRVIPAHPSPVVMRQAQVSGWLADRLSAVSRPVLVDAGRLDGSADQLDLLTAVDEVWVVVDPILEQVVAVRAVADWLNRTGTVELLVRERAGESVRDSARIVAATLNWPVAATVPNDRPSARALCGLGPAGRNLDRAPLIRTGRALAERLLPAQVSA
jgi:hypothetical protein